MRCFNLIVSTLFSVFVVGCTKFTKYCYNFSILFLLLFLVTGCMKFTIEDKHRVDVQRQLNSASKNFYELDTEMENIRETGEVPDL